MLEHVGRRTGIRRITPIHPEPTVDGFRVVVPLGEESQWARNVVAAGHCRIQLHDTVYELDEPRLVSPDVVEGLPRLVWRLGSLLGFRYLTLRTFSATKGSLDAPETHADKAPTEPAAKPRARRRQRIRLEDTEPLEGAVTTTELAPTP